MCGFWSTTLVLKHIHSIYNIQNYKCHFYARSESSEFSWKVTGIKLSRRKTEQESQRGIRPPPAHSRHITVFLANLTKKTTLPVTWSNYDSLGGNQQENSSNRLLEVCVELYELVCLVSADCSRSKTGKGAERGRGSADIYLPPNRVAWLFWYSFFQKICLYCFFPFFNKISIKFFPVSSLTKYFL